MSDLGSLVADLPLEQQAIKAKCCHPGGTHEVFRTTFPLVEGQPVQLLSENSSIDLPIVDLTQVLSHNEVQGRSGERTRSHPSRRS